MAQGQQKKKQQKKVSKKTSKSSTTTLTKRAITSTTLKQPKKPKYSQQKQQQQLSLKNNLFSTTKRQIVHHLESPDAAREFVTNSGSKLIVLKHSADWCGPCRMLEPKFAAMSDKFAEKANFASINADDFISTDINDTWPAVSVLPTLLFIKDNKCQQVVVGGNADQISETIQKLAI